MTATLRFAKGREAIVRQDFPNIPGAFRSLFTGKLLHNCFFLGAWLLEEKSKLTHKLSQIVTCHL